MAVRTVESRWPRASDNNLLPIDSLGYSTGNINDYVLVSYLTKRLYVGSENHYVVFVLSGAQVTSYEWSVRRYLYENNQLENLPAPAQREERKFYDIDSVSDNGLFSWTPPEEGRYKITVTIKDGQNIQGTLFLEHSVFETLTTQDYTDETRGALIASGQPDNPNLDLVAGEHRIFNEITHDLWEYLTHESIFDPNKIIPVNVFINILCQYILHRNKPERDGEIRRVGESWEGIVPNHEIRTGLGSRLIGLFDLSVVSAAMISGYIQWREKPDAPVANGKNVWTPIEVQMHDDFVVLSDLSKVDIFNLLRFPKSALRMAGILIRKLNIQNLPANSRNLDICKHFVRYTSFNEDIPNEILQKAADLLNTPIPLLASLFQINSALENIAAVNLQFTANAPVPLNGDVIALKNDLTTLGFSIATEGVPININNNPAPDNTNADGHYNLVTEWAVKEFQIYAKMKFIAKERENSNNATPYHEKLRRYPNLLRYTGPVSGVANEETRKLIKLWKALKWRCPVVISAFTGGPNYNNLHTANIWRHDFIRDPAPRVFVQDYSGYWGQLPNARVIGTNTNHDLLYDGKMSIGTFAAGLLTNYEGIHNSNNAFVWGGAWSNAQNNIIAGASATIDVVRSVILREAGNNFEVINSWDNAFLSLGYFHWTIGTREGNIYSRGELQGSLTYFKRNFPASFRQCMVFFGLDTFHHEMQNANNPQLAAFDNIQKKYSSDFRYQNENFGWDRGNQVRDIRQDINANNSPIRQFYGNHNYHRTWHSFYRWIMALRILVVDFRGAMWNLARMRLRDLQATDWEPSEWANGRQYRVDDTVKRNGHYYKCTSGHTANNNNAPANANFWADYDWIRITDANNNNLSPTLGQLFRSERAWALLLRWHVNRPAHVVTTNATDTIRTLYHFARCNRTATAGNPPAVVDVNAWISDNHTYLNGVQSNANNATTIRDNLGNAPQLVGNPFANPGNWATPQTDLGIPNQQMEEDFCKAIILYIRRSGVESLRTSMGRIYHTVINTQQNFVLDINGL